MACKERFKNSANRKRLGRGFRLLNKRKLVLLFETEQARRWQEPYLMKVVHWIELISTQAQYFSLSTVNSSFCRIKFKNVCRRTRCNLVMNVMVENVQGLNCKMPYHHLMNYWYRCVLVKTVISSYLSWRKSQDLVNIPAQILSESYNLRIFEEDSELKALLSYSMYFIWRSIHNGSEKVTDHVTDDIFDLKLHLAQVEIS